jgi:hypothetical protein
LVANPLVRSARLEQESTSAERPAALLLRQAEEAPAAVESALSQLVRRGSDESVISAGIGMYGLHTLGQWSLAEDGVTGRDFCKPDEEKSADTSA